MASLETPRAKVPVAVPLGAMVVGLIFIVLGVAHPSLLWNSGKVQAGRDALGDVGVSVIFIVFGLVFVGIGVVAFKRTR